MTETKPTNGLPKDRLNLTNNRWTKLSLTIDGSNPTNDWWQTLHESFSQYHHGLTDQSRSTDQTYNIIDWQKLFTWLWRWLPLRLSKRQPSTTTTVLFRTTLTRTTTLYELLRTVFTTIPNTSKFVKKHDTHRCMNRIFTSLLGVWKCGNTRSLVFDILLLVSRDGTVVRTFASH